MIRVAMTSEGYAPKGMILRRFGLESGMVFGKLRECMNVFITSIQMN